MCIWWICMDSLELFVVWEFNWWLAWVSCLWIKQELNAQFFLQRPGVVETVVLIRGLQACYPVPLRFSGENPCFSYSFFGLLLSTSCFLLSCSTTRHRQNEGWPVSCVDCFCWNGRWCLLFYCAALLSSGGMEKASTRNWHENVHERTRLIESASSSQVGGRFSGEEVKLLCDAHSFSP